MEFVLGQVKQIGMAALIMLCATGGTVGLLKMIKKVSPGGEFPKDPIVRKLEESNLPG